MAHEIFLVRYWGHIHDGPSPINDCFGNTFIWKGVARTEKEAISKAQYSAGRAGHPRFRVHSCLNETNILDLPLIQGDIEWFLGPYKVTESANSRSGSWAVAPTPLGFLRYMDKLGNRLFETMEAALDDVGVLPAEAFDE